MDKGQQHPGRVAWEVQAGGRSKEWGRVDGLFIIEDKKDAEIKELRAHIGHYRKQSGGAEQGGQGLPLRRTIGLEEVWGIVVEDEIESRKKLDVQRKKLQKESLKNSRVCQKGSGQRQE